MEMEIPYSGLLSQSPVRCLQHHFYFNSACFRIRALAMPTTLHELSLQAHSAAHRRLGLKTFNYMCAI